MTQSQAPFAAGPRERGYAEWFSWAKLNIGSDPAVAHACAEAAVEAADRGERSLEQVARQAATSRSGPGWESLAVPSVRAYAEWFDWARVTLGLSGEAQHQAAAAALDALQGGGDADAAAVAAQRAGHGPPLQEGLAGHGPPLQEGLAGHGPPLRDDGQALVLYRDPRRIAALLVIGTVAYFFWWLWQAFALARMERFPRARAFWWIFVPIYGWVVTYRVFDDLRRAELESTGSATFNPGLALGLCIASNVVARVNVGGSWGDVATTFIGSAIVAPAGYTWQSAANRYLDARYPGAAVARGLSVGEVIAVVIGLLFWALFFYVALSA